MININGELLAAEKASLSVFNRGFLYGDALFETIRVINGQIMFWEDHYFRLMASMRILRMDIPDQFSPEFLKKEILTLVKNNQLDKSAAKVKVNVFRDAEGLYLPQKQMVGYVISTEQLNDSFFIHQDNNYEVELFKDHYVQSGLLSTLKTNNKLPQILASIYADENAYDNCLLLNDKKAVIEASNANLFVVKGKTVKTPPLSDGCLNGIIRKQILGIFENLDDYQIEEASVSPFELQKADELFLTNAVQGITSISKYRKKEFENTLAKSLIGKLNAKARIID
ncbi:MAG: aminotransferase class IV [Bacteroidota bacterium]